MTSISKAKRDELVLLNSSGKDIFLAGFATSLLITIPAAVLLAPSYGGPGSLFFIAAALGMIFALSLAAGFIMPLEHRLIATYRLTSGFPIFSTISFIVWAGVSFVLYLGNPDFLGFRKFLTTFFVLPLLVMFGVSVLYSTIVRKVFITRLYKRSRLDYVTLFYKNTILDKLVPLWESTQRYGGHLSLFLVKLAFAPGTEEEEIELLDRATNVCRGKLRGSDEAGIFSRDTLWILFPQTSADESLIPGRRLLEILKTTPQFEAYRNKLGFRVTGSTILEADQTMLEPEDFVAAAARALQQGAKDVRGS